MFSSCCSTVRTNTVSVQHSQGGQHIIVKGSIQNIPQNITFDGEKVSGVPGKGKNTATAVVYKNESNRWATSYSNVNSLTKTDINLTKVCPKDIKDQKYISFEIKRQFYYKSNAALAGKIILAPLVFFLSLALEHEWYYDTINLYQMPGKDIYALDKVSTKFIKGEPITLLITAKNVGNLPQKDIFVITDALPDYMKFIEASYTTNGDVEKVGYDLHPTGNIQNLVFKVYPRGNGINPLSHVQIKIKVKPDVDKFLKDYKE